MQKQVVYCKLIPRLFAMTIDLVILSILITPIMNLISKHIFLLFFQDFFTLYSIDVNDAAAFSRATMSVEFTNYITAKQFLAYFSTLFLLNTTCMGFYFVFFWYKFNATPGKFLMKMKLVGADNYTTPSIYQLIKRFISYATVFPGLFLIIFNAKKMALHDKLANTVVIKR
ncbi:MAG: RDD family protein [Rickettsiaceae bacterium]